MLETDLQTTLSTIGLTPDEAMIYALLLDKGLTTGKSLVEKTDMSKGTLYRTLEQLTEKGLAERTDRGNKADFFMPTHPRNLERLIHARKSEASQAESLLQDNLGGMISQFNLLAGKPNVQMHEGKEGVKKVVFDSTNAQTEILTIADNEAMNRYYPNINTENISRRKRNSAKKRILSIDSQYIRNLAQSDDSEVTDRRLLKNYDALETVIQIYDNKVSYITLDPDRAIGVIIEDKALAATQRALFELLWNQSDSPYIK